MATLNSPFLLLLFTTSTLFLHTTTAATVPASPSLVGRYSPIPVDHYVVGLAKFAIEEHHKQSHDHLVYSRTVSAERQLVNGNNYRLVISAHRDHQKPDDYEAVVYVSFSGAERLTSFKKLLRTATTQASASSSTSASRPRSGLFIPIPNARNNTEVQKLGRFAVQEYNHKFNIGGDLNFSVVELADYQKIVEGANYYLFLFASEKGFRSEMEGPFEEYVYEALSGAGYV